MNLRNLISSTILNTRRHMRRTFLFLRRRTYPVQNRTRRFWRRYRNILGPSVFLLIVYASFHLLPSIQAFLEPHFSTNQEIERLRDLLLNTGSALMGAAAIVTSLVLFAMQVNIERMPYGLFRRLSADAILLGAFMTAFTLAVGVAILSTFIEQTNLGYTTFWATWSVVLILTLFICAYRRALSLINPMNQLRTIFRVTRATCRIACTSGIFFLRVKRGAGSGADWWTLGPLSDSVELSNNRIRRNDPNGLT